MAANRVTQTDVSVLAAPTSANVRVAQANVAVWATYYAPAHDISGYLRDALISHVFRSTPLAKPTSIWLALYTAPPTAAGGGAEVTGGSYARVQCGPGDLAWAGPTAGNGVATSLIDFVFPTPTADWGNVVAWGIHDAASGGNLLIFSTVTASTFVASGSNPRFVAGALTATFA
jgi:hypothetical protein